MKKIRPVAKISLLIWLSAMLNGCGGGGGSAESSVPPVQGTAPTASPDTLTILGAVSNITTTVVEVSLSIDGQSFTTSTDSQGNYELSIEFDGGDMDSLLILDAQGFGDEGYINFRSILGDLQSVKSAAGSDNQLTASELFAVNITSLTTATYGMTHIANASQLPSSMDAMRELEVQMRSEEVLMASAAIKLAIERAQAGQTSFMPEGMSTIELATSTDALNNFIKSVKNTDQALITNAKKASLSDPIAVNQQKVAGKDILFIYEPGVYSSAYEFFADGTGREHISARTRDFDWTEEANKISLDYRDWVVSSETSYQDSDGDGLDEEYLNQIVLVGGLVTFVSARDGYEIVNIENFYVSRTLNASEPGMPQLEPDEPLDWDQSNGAGRGAKAFHSSNGTMLTTPASDEQWVLPISRRKAEAEDSVYSEDLNVDFVNLVANFTGNGQTLGEFDWETDANGHLVLTTANAATIEFIPFANFLWGVVERDASGQVTGLNIAQGGKRQASALDLTPGYYTLDWSWMDDYNTRFWIQIKDNGTAQRVQTYDADNDGVINSFYGESSVMDGDWSIDGDRMIVNFYRSNGDYYGQPCGSEFEENCTLWNRRFWDMIAVDGDRYRMAHTHQFFDYLDDELTRYYLNSRDWVKVDQAPIELVNQPDGSFGSISDIGLSELQGYYRRKPIDNAWHDVWVGSQGDDWFWFNAAGQKWLMYEEDGKLIVDSAYGLKEINLQLDEQGQLTALLFLGEAYDVANNFEGNEGDILELGLLALKGSYERQPVESASDQVEVINEGDNWFWTNNTGSAWPLYISNGALLIDYGYTTRSVRIELDQAGSVKALWAGDKEEAYVRID